MASKRTLKKHIMYVCGEIAAECVISSNLIKGIDCDKMDNLVIKVAMLQAKTLKHVNIDFDKIPSNFDSAREYRKARNAYYRNAYRSLLESFRKEVVEIVNEMNSALPKRS